MRRLTVIFAALLAATGSIGAATVLSAPAEAATGPACRHGVVQPMADLNVSGTVCVRFANGRWNGSGALTLTATRAISGTVSWGATILPGRPLADWNYTEFAVSPGHPVTVSVDGVSAADPADSGAYWSAVVIVQNGIRAVGFEGQLRSPMGTRAGKASTASRYSRTTAWACSVQPVSDSGVSGEARLCVRQARGVVETSGSITYTSPDTVDARVGVGVDGLLGTAETSLVLPESAGTPRTVTLPNASSQVLSRDDTAESYLRITAVPVRSDLFPLS